ncbi:outer membrane immunogenic protein [Bradyrhizobium sp. USDA 4448]
MKKIALAAAALTMLTGAASAADLAARPYTTAPPPVAAVYDWTGFYIGGNVGYGWGEDTDPSLSFVNPGNAGNIGAFLTAGVPPGTSSGNLFPNLRPDGVFGGGQIGYDKQFGTWVAGVVADIQAADFKASQLVTTPAATTGANADESLSARIDWFGTVRGKLGFAANDWLFYGTGGLAYGEVKSSIGFACTPGGVACNGVSFAGSRSETKVGWAAGAGIAKAFGNWNVGVEYLHMDLGRSSVTAIDLTGNFTTTTITESQRIVEDMVRVTVNYKLGGAVVAKY